MFEATETRVLRRVLGALLALGVAGVLTFGLADPAREARTEMLSRHHGRLTSLVQKLERENSLLQGEVEGLRDGLEAWRGVARREHGMIVPGEVIFRFPVASR